MITMIEGVPSDIAMNTITFLIKLPEKYEPNLPNYYRKPTQGDLPMVDGRRVSWDEYDQLVDENPSLPMISRPTEAPSPVYNAMEENECYSRVACATLIDMTVNNIAYAFDDYRDVNRAISILTAYEQDTRIYVDSNIEFKAIHNNLRQTKFILIKFCEEYTAAVNAGRAVNHLRPKTIIELMAATV